MFEVIASFFSTMEKSDSKCGPIFIFVLRTPKVVRKNLFDLTYVIKILLHNIIISLSCSIEMTLKGN